MTSTIMEELLRSGSTAPRFYETEPLNSQRSSLSVDVDPGVVDQRWYDSFECFESLVFKRNVLVQKMELADEEMSDLLSALQSMEGENKEAQKAYNRARLLDDERVMNKMASETQERWRAIDKLIHENGQMRRWINTLLFRRRQLLERFCLLLENPRLEPLELEVVPGCLEDAIGGGFHEEVMEVGDKELQFSALVLSNKEEADSSLLGKDGKKVEEDTWTEPSDERYLTLFQVEDSEDNIRYFRQDDPTRPPKIKCSSLEKLVERLTTSKQADPDFLYDFLLTYRSFATSKKVLNLLVQRFFVPKPPNLNDKQEAMFLREVSDPIQIRVMNVLSQWVEKHFYDFHGDMDLTGQLLHFIEQTLMESAWRKKAEKLRESVMEKAHTRDGKKDSKKVPQFSEPAPRVQVSRAEWQDLGVSRMLEIKAIELARQLALMEHRLFNKIRPKECLNQAWIKGNRHRDAPNIIRLIEHFNKISRWVSTEIVFQPTLKERVWVLRKFIKIAWESMNAHNFNGVMEIVSGLHNAAVYRLRKTWEMLPSKYRQRLDKLNELTNSTTNYKRFRETIRAALPPSIPYLGLFLTDLTFVEEGNPNMLYGLINIYKRSKIAEVIRDIQQYQQTPYNLVPLPVVEEQLRGLKPYDDDQLYELSLQREPRK
eukprot:TRINITY_DN20163_c0_g1_i1.p1 TRINITY_DN20163_c0_g1~~TRINITY_DN20163_c0_g1_i1.p1  ORF type:complete len:655 (-),score=139.04 TRINITY_DN20163_c0_g1_i1:528-2492(-)